MDNEIKIRLAKLRELAERGATEGEKNAARKGIERLLKRYNLDDMSIDWNGELRYTFKYTTKLEMWLVIQISRVLTNVADSKKFHTWDQKVAMDLKYLDYVTIECAYEFFRRHMKAQWNKSALPELRKCRKAKTRNKKRLILQNQFFSEYCRKSGLFRDEDFITAKRTKVDAITASRLGDFEGGNYNQQVNNGLYLGGKS